MFLFFTIVFYSLSAIPGQGGGRGKGKASRDDGDSDFDDAPKKKASKSKAKVLPPPPPPTRAIVPELVEAASGGMVRVTFGTVYGVLFLLYLPLVTFLVVCFALSGHLYSTRL